MVTVIQTERKSAVLTSSSISCLKHMPTVNLTSGCAHGCLYCYTRSYSNYPGENKVILFKNTLEKLKDELSRKRVKPQAVYFSPSSDLFQPVPEVLALGYSVLEFLFSKGIGIAFLTKGHIPNNTMKLLLNHADKVRAQIGIITLDEDIRRMFEPNTASLRMRLEQMAMLTAGGIATEARLDPILPGLTDTPDTLRSLFSALAKAGVKQVAASALFLRPGILASFQRNILNKAVLQELLSFYRDAKRLAIHAEHSTVIALTHAARAEIYEHVRLAARVHGIELLVCACKNPDLSRGACNISGNWPGQLDPQRNLFSGGD
jgi:DNA repair photolyase